MPAVRPEMEGMSQSDIARPSIYCFLLHVAQCWGRAPNKIIFPICPPNDRRYTGPPPMFVYRFEPYLLLSIAASH
jgi:hypothetical protein